MVNRATAIILFTVIACSSCSRKDGDENKDGDINVENFDIEKSKEVLKNWKCSNISRDVICTPDNWREVKTNQVFYYSDLGDSIQNTYFAISKHNIDSTQLNAKRYLAEIYKTLKNDTIEVTLEYQLTELVFKDRVAYYGEFLSEKESIKYSYFMMLWEKEGTLYDFGLKSNYTEKDKYYKTFRQSYTAAK